MSKSRSRKEDKKSSTLKVKSSKKNIVSGKNSEAAPLAVSPSAKQGVPLPL